MNIDLAGAAPPARASASQLAMGLAASIRDGRLPPGTRLPPTAELARRHGVTISVMQQALADLQRRGLLDRSQRRGTFISNRQEALGLGLVIGQNLLLNPDFRFYQVLLAQLGPAAAAAGFHLRLYLPNSDGDATSALAELDADAAAGRLRALIALHRTALLDGWLERTRTLPVLEMPPLDYAEAARLGLGHLLDQGRRDIAVIPPDDIAAGAGGAYVAGAHAALAGRGLPAATIRVLPGGNTQTAGAATAARLLADGVPPALLIGDDNCARALLTGLLLAGIRIPGQCLPVCVANRGIDVLFPLQLTRTEFDPAATARALIANLAARLAGSPPPVDGLRPSLVVA